MAWLAWHGSWLLYANSEEHAGVIDTSGSAARIDLGPSIARLPGLSPDGPFDVAWR
jgi:hypothetical protein